MKVVPDRYAQFQTLIDQEAADALGTPTWPSTLKCAQVVVSSM